MIIKSYEINKKKLNLLKYNFILMHGENFGLKKDIKEIFINNLKQSDKNIEIISLYENEINEKEENFYNLIYSGSLFSNKKIIIINETTDKIMKKINDIYEKYPVNIFLIFLADILEKKSKLRNFFETNKETVCIPCYLDSDRDLQFIARSELNKIKISSSTEIMNLLVEKSNGDRNNLKNEIEKIKSFSLNKEKIDIDDIKSLINFSGDYKFDIFINECLSGNIQQYKKIISELYNSAVNQILLLRILSNKTQRLLRIKQEEKTTKVDNLDSLISSVRPAIFWKEKPVVKKQLTLWRTSDLKEMINEINKTEFMCKKYPNISKAILFNFFSQTCLKANNSF